MCFARINRCRNVQPEMRGRVPVSNLAMKLLDRLAHAQLLAKALARRVRRITLANIGVLHGALHPLNNVFGLVDTGKYRFGRSIHRHLAAKQHQFPPPSANRSDNMAGPRRKRPPSGGAPPTKDTSPPACSRRFTAISTSILAIIAPKQKCRPMPKAAWRAALLKAVAASRSPRKTSNVSGFKNRLSSRLADPRKQITSDSAGIGPPVTATSLRVRRGTIWVGAVKRRDSAKARSNSVQSARTAAN